MNPAHADFGRYSAVLNDVIHMLQMLIDLPRNACFEPLEAAPKCELCKQTVMAAKPHGPMLQLVLITGPGHVFQ
jgi:hypothetical protein